MRNRVWNRMIVGLFACSVLSLGLIAADKKASPKKARVYGYVARVGLSSEQRDKVAALQAERREKIAALEAEYEGKIRGVLSKEQIDLYDKLVKNKGKLPKADGAAKSAKQAADLELK